MKPERVKRLIRHGGCHRLAAAGLCVSIMLMGCSGAGQDAETAGNTSRTSGSEATSDGDSGTSATTAADSSRGASTATDSGATSGDDAGGGPSSGDAFSGGDDGPTYHGAVRGIMERRCTGCHVEEGSAPFPLTYQAAEWEAGAPWWSSLAVAAVLDGRMPPWKPTEDCRPIHGERRMEPDETEALIAWQATGFPEGEPSDYMPPSADPIVNIGDPDLVLDTGVDYTADASAPDDYRCHVLEHDFEETTFVRATTIWPDQVAIVHHVLLYLVEPDDVGQLDAHMGGDSGDDEEPKEGYRCFGGPKVTSQTIGGWVPGSQLNLAPDGVAYVIPAGSKIIMQVHYNTAYLAGEPPLPDRTQVAFWTMPEGEVPTHALHIQPYANLAIHIPAGVPEDVEQREYDLSPLATHEATVVGTAPHMHLLGTSIRSEIRRGEENLCVVEIEEWDFNWQQFYQFEEESFIQIENGDTHFVECVYDNSAENQAVVNGLQLEPLDVNWGDSSFDEMCLVYLVVMRPYVGDETNGCEAFKTCHLGCDDGDFFCFVGCAMSTNVTCFECMRSGVGACGQAFCPEQTQTLSACVSASDAEPESAFLNDCPVEFEAFFQCVDVPLKAGQCNAEIEGCGVAY